MSMKRTIVTVVLDFAGKRQDLDLPSNLPLNRLGELIFAAMDVRVESPRDGAAYRVERSEYGQQWERVDNGLTLEEANIWDGYFLRLEKHVSFSTITDQQQTQLFQDQIPLFSDDER